MSEEHENYRPRSPDLSGLPPPPGVDRLPLYHPPDTAFPAGYSFSPRGSYDASPYFSPQLVHPSTSYFGSQAPSASPATYSPQAFRAPSLPTANSSQFQPAVVEPFTPTHSDLTQSRYRAPLHRSSGPPDHHPPTQPLQPQQSHIGQPPHFDMARTRQKRSAEDYDLDYDPNNRAPSRTSTQVKQEQPPPAPPIMPVTSVDPAHSIDVKTKFPIARIKRIMQADEDVGKVAQATPTAVSKALELFMITLVVKGASEARAQNSKRVTAQHLKAALMKDGQFDFLTEICEAVPDDGAKKKREDSEEADIGGGGGGAPRKKSKGSKKRKDESDDESD